ncbi:MAG: hypothetical protein L0Y66_03405 [Myxococcaceae bacterium]|nr:hypothetical protein [Myxococcaceae bacterium]MCI0672583.1 hypothetical protein [Myxococcaceae bacterium]
MRYTVRTPEGELTLPDRVALERAMAVGLVGPEDEVCEEGTTRWLKAGSVPGLTRAAAAARGWTLPPKQLAQVVAIVVLGLIALALMLSGTVELAIAGALIAFSVAGWLFVLTQQAFSIKRRR